MTKPELIKITAAPSGYFRSSMQRVLPAWIDYNGHMNVAYYTLAMDNAFDEFLHKTLGIGPAYVATAGQGPYALQAHYHYFDELLEAEAFFVDVRLIDHDKKRMHLYAQITKADGTVAASVETVLLNVDLGARKATEYSAATLAKLRALQEAQADVPRPAQLGAALGLSRGKTHPQ